MKHLKKFENFYLPPELEDELIEDEEIEKNEIEKNEEVEDLTPESDEN